MHLAVPIYLENTADKPEPPKEGEEPKAPQPINDTHPLWLKAPKDCTEDEYKETYRKLFNTFEEPLFWIHLNVDYPFNLKGILYFPRIRKDFGGQEGEIKLFNRQVFVADNIKEIVPEFLLLLRGVLDCPDLPLNVSRSFLQNDGYVKRLSSHITKKVADKLNGLMNTEREKYETYWDDIHPFVKYGCLRDEKFYEQIKGSLLLKTTAGEHYTLAYHCCIRQIDDQRYRQIPSSRCRPESGGRKYSVFIEIRRHGSSGSRACGQRSCHRFGCHRYSSCQCC